MAFWDAWPLVGEDKSNINREVMVDRFSRQELLSAHDYTFTKEIVPEKEINLSLVDRLLGYTPGTKRAVEDIRKADWYNKLSYADKAIVEAQVKRGEPVVIPGTVSNVQKGLISQSDAEAQTPGLTKFNTVIDGAFGFFKSFLAKILVSLVLILFVFFLVNNFVKRKLG